MTNEVLNESSDGEDFSWSEYLKESNAKPAPSSYFCQSLIPPSNEFEIDHKVETFDPRNTTSTCLGTIIEKSGPRIRLRLDGTDNRNDFWLMVDSDLIHKFGYSVKNSKKIQPPLGFGNDLSKWPKFLEKIIQSSNEKVFASENCFKSVPSKPVKNEFKIGHKIEAVDPKNPHLICPATIKEVKRDKILVTFDGWLQSSQSWYSFTSRDIYPVGWCKIAGHILQYPGYLVDKKTNSSINKRKSSNEATTILLTPTITNIKKDENSKLIKSPPIVKPPKKKGKQTKNSTKTEKLINNNNLDVSSDSSSLNITVDVANLTANTTLKSPTNQAANKNQVSTPNTQPNSKLAHIDLSIVKQEAIDSGNEDSNGHLKNVNLNSNGEINSQNNFLFNSSTNKKSNAYVHLIPNGNCGPYIKTEKFHVSHTKFGPGSASSVYKSIIQSFVDCAINRYEVFKLIPEGKSQDIVRLKNTNYNERKRLIVIENTNDMWSNLKAFCKLLEIDDENLFSKHKSTPFTIVSNENDKPITGPHKNENNVQNENLKKTTKPQPISPNKYKQGNNESKVPNLLNIHQNSSLKSPQPSRQANPSLNLIENQNNINLKQNIKNIESHGGSENGIISKSISQKRSSAAASLGLGNSKLNNDGQGFCDLNNGESVSKVSKLDNSYTSLPSSEWNIDQVVHYIGQLNDNYFASYVDTFKTQEIDGKALVLLTTDILMKYMGFKLGPALKLNNFIDKLRKNLIANLNVLPNSNYNQVLGFKTECT